MAMRRDRCIGVACLEESLRAVSRKETTGQAVRLERAAEVGGIHGPRAGVPCRIVQGGLAAEGGTPSMPVTAHCGSAAGVRQPPSDGEWRKNAGSWRSSPGLRQRLAVPAR